MSADCPEVKCWRMGRQGCSAMPAQVTQRLPPLKGVCNYLISRLVFAAGPSPTDIHCSAFIHISLARKRLERRAWPSRCAVRIYCLEIAPHIIVLLCRRYRYKLIIAWRRSGQYLEGQPVFSLGQASCSLVAYKGRSIANHLDVIRSILHFQGAQSPCC